MLFGSTVLSVTPDAACAVDADPRKDMVICDHEARAMLPLTHLPILDFPTF